MQKWKRVCIAIFFVNEKLKTIRIAHANNKKGFAFPLPKMKWKSHCQCKKQKKIALPMQKLKRICIAHANNEKDLHSQCQK